MRVVRQLSLYIIVRFITLENKLYRASHNTETFYLAIRLANRITFLAAIQGVCENYCAQQGPIYHCTDRSINQQSSLLRFFLCGHAPHHSGVAHITAPTISSRVGWALTCLGGMETIRPPKPNQTCQRGHTLPDL